MTQRFGEGGWSAIASKTEVLKQLRASRVLVAKFDGEVVGTVRLAAVKSWAVDWRMFTRVPSALYVLGLAVTPTSRGRGFGRALMEAAKDATRSSSTDALWLDAYDSAAGAGPFYARCGFRHVGNTSHNGRALLFYEWLAGPVPV